MDTYFLIQWPEIQKYENKPGFEDNSYLCTDIPNAYFILADWYYAWSL